MFNKLYTFKNAYRNFTAIHYPFVNHWFNRKGGFNNENKRYHDADRFGADEYNRQTDHQRSKEEGEMNMNAKVFADTSFCMVTLPATTVILPSSLEVTLTMTSLP